MIRVTHLIAGLRLGGAESMVARLLENRNHEEFDQVVISLERSGPMGRVVRDAGVDVHAIGDEPVHRRLPRLFHLLRRRRRGILMTWLYHSDLVGTVLGRILGVEALIWNLRRETGLHDPLKLRMQVGLLASMSRTPELVISNSMRGIETHKQHGYDPRRWEVIPNGFDVDRFRPDPSLRERLRASYGVPIDEPIVGMAACFHPVKNHRGFLEVAEIVRQRVGRVHFVLAGAGSDWSNEELRTWINELNLQENVTLLGPIEEMEPFYRILDLYVCPSKAEGFPNSVAEAMASGVACVVTDVGDMRVLAGDVCPIVDVNDLRELALRAVALLEDDAERERIANEARKRVVSEFSIDEIVGRFEQIYREVASRKGLTD